MKKALVINPWVTDFKLYDEWMHPVGLYFLLTLLKNNDFEATYFNCLSHDESNKTKANGTGNFTSTVIDKPLLYKDIHRNYKVYGVNESQLIEFLKTQNHPDIIFIGSSMTYWFLGLVKTIELVRSIFQDLTIVVGGLSAALIPEIIQSKFKDIHVFGGSLFSQLDISTSNIPVLSTFKALPPDQSLIPAIAQVEHFKHGPMLSSLGCPYSCSYCASKVLQKSYYARNTETTSDEIIYLQNTYNVKDFASYDDALLYHFEEIFLPLMDSLKRKGFKGRFHTPNGLHARWITKKILDCMKESGFSTIRLGYESGKAEQIVHTDKKISQEMLTQKVELIKSSGFKRKDVGVYIMAGLPNQLPEHVFEEMEFVSSLGVQVKPVFLSPVPKTVLFNEYAKQFPQLLHDPLYQNDSFFISLLENWNAGSVQGIMDKAKEFNCLVG